ncbi:MAG: DedA family protein [Nanoarchaeota archaeon]
MVDIIDFLLHIDKYLDVFIQNYGSLVYLILFFVIFLETGFVLTPFLPGDSLLFVAGTFAGTGYLNLYLLLIIFSAAAILGDSVNYFIGNYFGEKVFLKFINTKYLEKTKTFYEKYGKKTIVLARFVPIVRTFAPFVAGVGKMRYPVFLWYNIIGGVVWVFLAVFAGYFFGQIPFVEQNLTIFVLLIIFLSFIPIIVEYLRQKKGSNKIR